MSSTLVILVAYLTGSIPFSYLVVRLLTGVDIRRVGSGNPGATNVSRVAGGVAAVLVLALDIGKGALPVLAAQRLGLPDWAAAGAALAAVLGHVFPLYLGFRGGKGVATAIGVLGALAPLPTLAAAAVFILVVAWSGFVSLGSIVAVPLIPMLLLAGGLAAGTPPPSATVAGSVLIAILVLLRHTSNVRRLRAGTEGRLGEQIGARKA